MSGVFFERRSQRASKKSHPRGKTAVPAVQANSRLRLFGQAGGMSALTGEDACLPDNGDFLDALSGMRNTNRLVTQHSFEFNRIASQLPR